MNQSRIEIMKERLKDHEESLNDMVSVNKILASKVKCETKIKRINELFKSEINAGRYAKSIGENIVYWGESIWSKRTRKITGQKYYYSNESINRERQQVKHLKNKINRLENKMYKEK